MKKMFYLLVTLLAFSSVSCSVYETIVNLSRLQFKLGEVNGFELNGVNISNKMSLSDFNAAELLKITTAVAQGTLPVSFVLNVDAKNPNDGTGGYKRTDATLKDFPWRLMVDGKETISGDLDNPVTVPGTGEVTVIPLRMNIDLMDFFKNKGYESLINLALNLGGQSGTASKLTLFAKPVVTTSIGNISYPGELKIVDAEFTGQ